MLEILDTIQVGDVLFHVLDNLDLFGMEIQSSLYGRGFYLFPLGKRQEYIFATETPQYYLCRPISLEDRSFIVFHELLQFRLVTESNVKNLVKIAGFRFLPFIEIKFSLVFGREISVLGIGF